MSQTGYCLGRLLGIFLVQNAPDQHYSKQPLQFLRALGPEKVAIWIPLRFGDPEMAGVTQGLHSHFRLYLFNFWCYGSSPANVNYTLETGKSSVALSFSSGRWGLNKYFLLPSYFYFFLMSGIAGFVHPFHFSLGRQGLHNHFIFTQDGKDYVAILVFPRR